MFHCSVPSFCSVVPFHSVVPFCHAVPGFKDSHFEFAMFLSKFSKSIGTSYMVYGAESVSVFKFISLTGTILKQGSLFLLLCGIGIELAAFLKAWN